MFCHKFSPKKLDDILYNKVLKENFKKLSLKKTVPNMLINGMSGTGKRTFCYGFLNEIYGSDIYNLNSTTIKNGSSTIKYLHSNFHIEIDLSIYNSSDRNILINFIKEYASTNNINTGSYKILVFLNAEKISINFFYMLRRLLEKTMTTARYIFLSKNMSSIPVPIQSRLIIMRTKVLNKDETLLLLKDLYNKHCVEYNEKQVNKIIENSYNIKKVINLYHIVNFFQLAYLGEDKKFKRPVHKDHRDFNSVIEIIVSSVINEKNLVLIRELIKTKYNECYPLKDMLIYIHEKLLDEEKIEDNIKFKLINLIADIEHKMNIGDKEILYLENYIYNAINLIR